eukprot:comp18896_c0_seq1/m.21024 comp18896_c0_seq1/g.21024  ORF comp18896_c0_seq1/g.21024 comp18896_c0_seq1/m.21024 type:complete len:370 (-) comp18896_c0_seq1:361-1470(-)
MAAKTEATIVVLAGDGIGPEVTAEAVRVLELVAEGTGRKFTFVPHLIGGGSVDKYGTGLSDEALEACKASDAILLGAVGGPKWAKSKERPEAGLLRLRKDLGLFANLRPVFQVSNEVAAEASPLKAEVIENVDFMVVRELTGGIYFGKRQEEDENGYSYDVMEYSVSEVERVTRVAAELARKRRGKITSVDKNNVLATSRLWRRVTQEVIDREYPDVQLEHTLVDSAAMHLLRRPRDFDVILTENMFGDILTDEASMLAGSLGLLPSASLGAPGTPGVYEPIHGSAPDIAGQGIANPCGTILSAAMLLRHTFGFEAEAQAIEKAVSQALAKGARTADIKGPDGKFLSTQQMGDAVLAELKPLIADLPKA